MNVEILHSPGNAVGKVTLAAGEQWIAESGAMIAMSPTLEVTTSIRTKGSGFFKGVKRLLGGESLFINTFQSSSGGTLLLAPKLIGDMLVYELDGRKELMVQGSSYVGCASGVSLDTNWAGLKSALFSGESAFWLRLSGQGPVLLNSFGAIYEKNLRQDYIVDTGHIVAFENTLHFNIRKAGASWFSAIMGGEGLVCQFSGMGRLFCQTHNAKNFGTTLGPRLKPTA